MDQGQNEREVGFPPVSSEKRFEPTPRPLDIELEDRFKMSSEGFQQFLHYLRTNVAPEALVANRTAQANLDRYIDHGSGFNSKNNPYPTLEFREWHDSESGNFHARQEVKKAFMLKGDDSHIYYFTEWWATEERAKEFLRDEDRVPIENYCSPKYPKTKTSPQMPFTKDLRQVSIQGGKPRRYNYHLQDWELLEKDGNAKAVDIKQLENAKKKLQSVSKYFSYGENVGRRLRDAISRLNRMPR